jgi:flagellar protein FlbD
MIQVTKIDGTSIVLNAEWIQSVEKTPDTLITLTTGLKILVRDRVEEIVEAFKSYKREIQTLAPSSRASGETA